MQKCQKKLTPGQEAMRKAHFGLLGGIPGTEDGGVKEDCVWAVFGSITAE